MPDHILEERTWLTADKSRTVAEGDPEAAHLLGNKGAAIPEDEAARLGLLGKRAQKAAQADADEAAAEPDVTDKAVRGPRDKG